MGFFPSLTPLNAVITSGQLLLLGAGFQELVAPTPYSKFTQRRPQIEVPQRVAMLAAYVPAALVSVVILLMALKHQLVPVREVAACCLSIHFLKRVVEVLFLHRYSGKGDLGVLGGVGLYYALLCALIVKVAGEGSTASEGLLGPRQLLGLSLFVVGEFGNFYHHVLLAQLRAPEGKGAGSSEGPKYMLPTGGLFEYVTMPHYFFELIAWYGLAVTVWRLNAFLVAADMTSYLAGRSVATTRWYKEKFGPLWPTKRHLVPGIF